MREDDEFVQAFEACTLPKTQFTHAAHVRAAWWYLQHYPLGEAIDRFRATLRAYAASLGATGDHETLTIAWLLLIAERLDDGTRALTWREFAHRHPELFGAPPLVTHDYTEAMLASARARTSFVMPDAGSRRC
jgi:N-formylglutamate deformylase